MGWEQFAGMADPVRPCIRTSTEYQGASNEKLERNLLVIVALVCFAPKALAQTGSFAGSVTDSTGAEVPNAKITALNMSTGICRTAETDESGTYRITNLSPGIYDVRIECRIQEHTVSRMPLNVDAVLTLDAKLVISSAKKR